MKTFFARDDLSKPENWKRYCEERDAFLARYDDRAKGLAAWRNRDLLWRAFPDEDHE